MRWLDIFRNGDRRDSAKTAKDRLQVIIAHERSDRVRPDYMAQLQRDVLEVIKKYVEVQEDQVTISFDREGGMEVLELNIALPDRKSATAH